MLWRVCSIPGPQHTGVACSMGETLPAVQERICEVRKALLRAKLPFGAKAAQPMSLDDYEFKHEKGDYNVYWDVRKGLIPIVGAARETGARLRMGSPWGRVEQGFWFTLPTSPSWAPRARRVRGILLVLLAACHMWWRAAFPMVLLLPGLVRSFRGRGMRSGDRWTAMPTLV